jgi:transcriptional regulator with GAF, ATPase, and Fis domain
VGGGKECELTLSDRSVSRHHLTLRVEDGHVRVVDMGSRNGTRVDGLRIFDCHARPDSTIALGRTTLRLQLSSDWVSLPLSRRERFGGILGASVPMRRLLAVLERVARTDTTVLIQGETGTGKELIAEALHDEGRRAGGPFVVFDCSAVSPQLMESELFGHVRGAFTGAITDRKGAFEAAEGGTVFLDEIGELPLDLQPKLLRALERLEVKPVGSQQTRQVDVRIVAATNRSLAREVEAGRFREDLYYRLAVVSVRPPPLRERPEDIPLLARHFARHFALRHGMEVELSEKHLRRLARQAWPGNVRELKNAVMRILSLGPPASMSTIGPEDGAPAGAMEVDLSVPLKQARDRLADAFERAYVVAALEESGGNITRAAELAGVHRKFIHRAIQRHGLRDHES